MNTGPLIHLQLVTGESVSGRYAHMRLASESMSPLPHGPRQDWPLRAPAFVSHVCLDVVGESPGQLIAVEYNADAVVAACADAQSGNWHSFAPEAADCGVHLQLLRLVTGLWKTVSVFGLLARAWVAADQRRWLAGYPLFTGSIPLFTPISGGFQLIEYNPRWVLSCRRG